MAAGIHPDKVTSALPLCKKQGGTVRCPMKEQDGCILLTH